MTIAAVTRLRLRPNASRAQFIWLSMRCWWQAWRARGNIASRVRQAGPFEYWTLTVWQDQRSLTAFVSGSPHRSAMPRLSQWCDESSSAHWTVVEPDERPTWRAAALALGRYGRIHRVAAPSPAQSAGLPLGSRGLA